MGRLFLPRDIKMSRRALKREERSKLLRKARAIDEPKNWEIANGEGKMFRAMFGRGGERTIECPLQNQSLKVGFVWSVPVSSKENDRVWTNRGGEAYHRWGGPKPFLGEGFYGMFPIPWVFPSREFSHPLSFPPPFVFLWQAPTAKMGEKIHPKYQN